MTITSEQQMINLGKKIAAGLRGGDVVLLYGDLGAGKTTLTKGIALGLGVKSNIVSPTFTLMQIYKIQDTNNIQYPIYNFVHIDTYRLEDEKQLLEIGAQDYIGDPETVCVIEWAEKVEKLISGKKIIKIKIGHARDGREVVVEELH
jgi:tRNA threonylcarbamoyladenosine biosynthesis protein TsaE